MRKRSRGPSAPGRTFSRDAAGTHTTRKPTASKVAQALRECRGEVTTATTLQPRGHATWRILSASVRVDDTESMKITSAGVGKPVTIARRSAESETDRPPYERLSTETNTAPAFPSRARARAERSRSRLALRIRPSGVRPCESAAIASTRGGIGSRRTSGPARAETTGV